MQRIALTALAALVGSMIVSPIANASLETVDQHIASLTPAVSFTGGTTEQRQTVSGAAARFAAAGLSLPDLDVHIHQDRAACRGNLGYMHPEATHAVIVLCFDREHLALHEIGHAWEHFALEDPQRAEFQALVGADTWGDSSVDWNNRGIEIAANVIATGLTTADLKPGEDRSAQFELFEVLTGTTSPRDQGEVQPATSAVEIDQSALVRAAAYAEWRQSTVTG